MDQVHRCRSLCVSTRAPLQVALNSYCLDVYWCVCYIIKYVKSVRGRNGGLLLARAPELINIGELVKSTEATSVLVECFVDKTNTCIITPACGFKGVLHEALEAYMNTLNKYTLRDLMGQQSDLAELLRP